MISFLKYKVYSGFIAINIFAAWGFYEFFKTGSTILLWISLGSLLFHLLLYFFFVNNNKKV